MTSIVRYQKQAEAAANALQIPADEVFNFLRDRFPQGKGAKLSDEELSTALVLIGRHKLDPFTKEVYVVRTSQGVQTFIGYDAWLRKLDEHPQYNGCEYLYGVDDGDTWCEVRLHRKDRDFPTIYRAYESEWRVEANTNWKQRPRHMLMVRATCHAARVFTSIAAFHEGEEHQFQEAPETTVEVLGSSEKPIKLVTSEDQTLVTDEEKDAFLKDKQVDLAREEVSRLMGELPPMKKQVALNKLANWNGEGDGYTRSGEIPEEELLSVIDYLESLTGGNQ